jgi:hypothetical protein
MKKIITLISFLVLLPGLVACSSVANAGTATQASTGFLLTDYENALSVPIQLAIGTFKLESTTNKIDAKTANGLLPLWKAVRSLSSSSTAAPQELDALYKQIQETMMPEQVAAISAMHITQEDMAQVAQEMGLSLGGGGFGNFTPEQRAATGSSSGQAGRQSGQGFPGGGFPGGGFSGGGPGGGFNPQQSQTPIAGQEGTSRTTQGVNPLMLDAIIKFLQAKV